MAESLPLLGREMGTRLLLGTGSHALLSATGSLSSSGVVVCSIWMSSLEVSVGGGMSPLRAQLLGFARSKNYLEPRDSKLAPATQRKSYHM